MISHLRTLTFERTTLALGKRLSGLPAITSLESPPKPNSGTKSRHLKHGLLDAIHAVIGARNTADALGSKRARRDRRRGVWRRVHGGCARPRNTNGDPASAAAARTSRTAFAALATLAPVWRL